MHLIKEATGLTQKKPCPVAIQAAPFLTANAFRGQRAKACAVISRRLCRVFLLALQSGAPNTQTRASDSPVLPQSHTHIGPEPRASVGLRGQWVEGREMINAERGGSRSHSPPAASGGKGRDQDADVQPSSVAVRSSASWEARRKLQPPQPQAPALNTSAARKSACYLCPDRHRLPTQRSQTKRATSSAGVRARAWSIRGEQWGLWSGKPRSTSSGAWPDSLTSRPLPLAADGCGLSPRSDKNVPESVFGDGCTTL